MGNAAYYTAGPYNYPFISTFSDGGIQNDTLEAWRYNEFANEMYFVPDFDGTSGYYTAAAGWWDYWGDYVDGLFSWESAWPERAGLGGQYPGDISPDQTVIGGTSSRGKSYMMPLSSLQYKDAYSTNLYRAGDLNLPTRMSNILGMSPSPDFVQIISWVSITRQSISYHIHLD